MNRIATAALLLALAALPAGAVEVELLSRIAPGSESATASGASRPVAISGDGRYAVFLGTAVNLVPGMPHPQAYQLFLYDRATGMSTLISHTADSPNVGGNNGSGDQVSISGNGRFVAFTSYANDLAPGVEDGNGTTDVYLWDRVTGETVLVSRQAGSRTTAATGTSSAPAISANGRFVAFESLAPDLMDLEDQLPFNPPSDVYLWDRRTGEILPVSRSAVDPGRMAEGSSSAPAVSADGRYVAFQSWALDVAAGQNDRNEGAPDVFVWDRVTGTSVLVSHAAASPLTTANAASFPVAISADGRSVAFTSAATNLVPRQRGVGTNVFLWTRETGQVALVSHRRDVPGHGVGIEISIRTLLSSDGAWVLFASVAPDLVRNQGESTVSLDIFLWSRPTGKNVLVSRPLATGSPFAIPWGLSSEGAWALYSTTAAGQVPGVTDGNNRDDLFLFDRRTGKRTLVSFSSASPQRTGSRESVGAFLSADGRWIAYTTEATDLVPGTRDVNSAPDVVLQSRNGEREIVTLHAEGLTSVTPQGESLVQSTDASGRFVLFTSTADAGLLVPGVRDVNRVEDLFLYDRQLRTVQLLTRSADNPRTTVNSNVGGSLRGRLSADGRFVAFLSNASDVVPEIRRALTNKVYLWERATGRTTWIAGFFFGSQHVAISADGSAVAFDSREPDVVPGQVDTPGTLDVFVWDRATGTKTLVSRAAGSAAAAANAPSSRPLLSADGRIVAYTSEATNLLAAGTTAEGADVFLFDRQTATTTLASGAVATPQTELGRTGLDLSDDGRFVLFENHAQFPGTGPNPFDSVFDLYLFDRVAGTTALVTHTADSLTTSVGEPVPNETASLSADGRFAAFASTMASLVPGQASPPGSTNVFVFDRESGAIELVSRAAGTVTTAGSGLSSDPVISADGRRVAFVSNRLDLTSGSTGPTAGNNLFVHDRITRATTLVSHSFEDPARRSDGSCGLHVLSANGTVAAFSCNSTDLVPGDFNDTGGPSPDAFAATVP